MIHSHLYASKSETPVYVAPLEDGMPLHLLHRGDWVGELTREADWVRIVGVECDGWVRAEDLESRPPFQLHAYWTDGKPIEYINVEDNE
ncbi:MAG: hypothetical protein SH808_00305 [Saprospiraceae bacterium]|nr:hypothetical protein [Saprospiraceae bacterium]